MKKFTVFFLVIGQRVKHSVGELMNHKSIPGEFCHPLHTATNQGQLVTAQLLMDEIPNNPPEILFHN